MASLWDTIQGVLGGGIFSKSGRKYAKNFLTGQPGKHEQLPLLTPEQEKIKAAQEAAVMGSGAPGAFGTAADYWRDLMSNDSKTLEMLSAPELRRFNEEIIPGLAEQFAGMGSGALSSSGFRNEAINAGTDLSERLGALRAQLRQQGAQGLASLGQSSLNPVVENVYYPGQPGFLEQAAPIAGQIAGTYFGGPAGGAAGSAIGSSIGSKFGGSPVAKKTSPYGRNMPSIGANPNFQLPNFGMR